MSYSSFLSSVVFSIRRSIALREWICMHRVSSWCASYLFSSPSSIAAALWSEPGSLHLCRCKHSNICLVWRHRLITTFSLADCFMKDRYSHISHSHIGISSLLIEHSWGNTRVPPHWFIHNFSLLLELFLPDGFRWCCWRKFKCLFAYFFFSHVSQPKAISILLWASCTHTGSSKSVPFPPL